MARRVVGGDELPARLRVATLSPELTSALLRGPRIVSSALVLPVRAALTRARTACSGAAKIFCAPVAVETENEQAAARGREPRQGDAGGCDLRSRSP